MVPWFLSRYQLLDFEKENATFRAFKNQPKNAITLFDASIFDCFKWCELILNITIKSIKHTFHPVPCSKSLWSFHCFVSPFTARFPNKVHSRFLWWKISTPTLSLSRRRRLKLLEEKLRFIGESSQSWAALEELEWFQVCGNSEKPILEEKVGGFIPLETYIG